MVHGVVEVLGSLSCIWYIWASMASDLSKPSSKNLVKSTLLLRSTPVDVFGRCVIIVV